MLPCQDAPSVKATYDAKVTVPKDLVALMSAERGAVSENGDKKTYSFNQKIGISSYLIALAVGALVSRDIGPRSKVWSEAEMVEAGAYEFAETEKFISIAEDIVGKYIWGTYDVLLLPPSFPYGGMENPMLTFVTPTLLAGDRSVPSFPLELDTQIGSLPILLIRSNADVVAHEVSHSWTGNLVTNKTWECVFFAPSLHRGN
jgi:leukotriene-A4 hydrolase